MQQCLNQQPYQYLLVGAKHPHLTSSSKNRGININDWLPILHRAATWNEWSEEKLHMQLAHHTRGRALQGDLLDKSDKVTFTTAVQSL